MLIPVKKSMKKFKIEYLTIGNRSAYQISMSISSMGSPFASFGGLVTLPHTTIGPSPVNSQLIFKPFNSCRANIRFGDGLFLPDSVSDIIPRERPVSCESSAIVICREVQNSLSRFPVSSISMEKRDCLYFCTIVMIACLPLKGFAF